MFGKLKEKLKEWTKKVANAEEETSKENLSEEKIDEIVKKEAEKIDKEAPVEFNAEMKQFQPSSEKLQEEAESNIKEVTADISEKENEEITSSNIRMGKEINEKKEGGHLDKEEKQNLFKKLGAKITKIKITEKEFEVYSEELQDLLLENNVAFEVTEKIIDELKLRIVGKELLKKEIAEEIEEAFKEIMREILIKPFKIADKVNEKWEKEKEPFVILFCGINGSGKTTSIAKIADNLQKQGISCVLAAGDTFRAAAIHQLQEHGKKLDIKVIAQDYGSDPAAVGFDAVKYAKKNLVKCVLIDTAGRMHTSKDLMREIEKISKVTKPDLKIFVGESITGNDATEQAKSFNWSIGIDGIVLTKSDIDEKGGTSLSVGHVTKKPILYLGTGQVYEDIEVFDKEKFLKRLGL